jgi:hypothetical protein
MGFGDGGRGRVMHARRLVIGIAIGLAALPAGRGGSADAPPGGADEATLKAARLGSDGPSLLGYFRQRTVGEADRARIVSLIRQLGDPAFAVREKASAELEAVGLPAVGLLRQAERDPDVEIVRRAERCLQRIEKVPSTALSAAAARLVARRPPDGAADVLLNYLPLADDETVGDEVRDALAAVARADRRSDAVLLKALDDPLPLRRGAAAEALARSGRPELVDAARRATADPNLEARLRATLALVTSARDKAAVPKLIALLGELPQSLGWRAEEVLVRLAGGQNPNASLGADAAARERCRAAWQAWWDRNGAGVDLARLDGAPRQLGYTLVVLIDAQAMGAPGLPGRVFELNAQHEVLWKIDGLQYPIDAKVVGADRVLIAEYHSHRVSERDFSGKVIWSRNVLMPVSVQRLPDGHTFIASRNMLMELDAAQPDGNLKQVWSHPRAQQDLIAAYKTRGGEIALLTNGGQCVRLDAARKEVGSFPVNFQRGFMFFPGIEVLPSGRLLLTQAGGVREYDPDGKPGWQASARQPTSAQRLPNGNTLVSELSGKQVLEMDRNGQPVWEYKPADGSTPLRAYRR